MKTVIRESFKETLRLGDNKIKPEHLILTTLVVKNNEVTQVLSEMGSDIEDLTEKLESYLRIKIKNPNIVEPKIIPLNVSSKNSQFFYFIITLQIFIFYLFLFHN